MYLFSWLLTWTLTPCIQKLQVAQSKMGRTMLGVTLSGRIKNTEMRNRTKLSDVDHIIAQ